VALLILFLISFLAIAPTAFLFVMANGGAIVVVALFVALDFMKTPKSH